MARTSSRWTRSSGDPLGGIDVHLDDTPTVVQAGDLATGDRRTLTGIATRSSTHRPSSHVRRNGLTSRKAVEVHCHQFPHEEPFNLTRCGHPQGIDFLPTDQVILVVVFARTNDPVRRAHSRPADVLPPSDDAGPHPPRSPSSVVGRSSPQGYHPHTAPCRLRHQGLQATRHFWRGPLGFPLLYTETTVTRKPSRDPPSFFDITTRRQARSHRLLRGAPGRREGRVHHGHLRRCRPARGEPCGLPRHGRDAEGLRPDGCRRHQAADGHGPRLVPLRLRGPQRDHGGVLSRHPGFTPNPRGGPPPAHRRPVAERVKVRDPLHRLLVGGAALSVLPR